LLAEINKAGAEQAKSDSNSFADHVWQSFEYNLIQAPVNGITQIIDHCANTKLLPEVQFCSAPKPSEFGSKAWLGDIVGGTAACSVQLGLLHRFIGAGAAANVERQANYGLKAALPSIGKSMVTGVFVGGFLTPVDESDGGNFLEKKFL